jgi:hypothetical protein
MAEQTKTATPTDPIARYRGVRGRLAQVTGAYPFALWRPGDEWITLDGDFSAAELHAFADHMDATPRRDGDETPPESKRRMRAA